MTGDRAAIRYAEAFDRHIATERQEAAAGRYDEANAAHERAIVALRALRVEIDDPTPRPPCGCGQCQLAYAGMRRIT